VGLGGVESSTHTRFDPWNNPTKKIAAFGDDWYVYRKSTGKDSGR
jgi:hypothetical protein